ncbi:MAG: hypothetical protein L0H79_16595 [Intrasporangium sp.]|uniref:hypothetical protein n=1 Tax=Intrasporangium sp. TaxID=1925024 RepID=UPI002647F878|nr:hypothetical protein [Intrasporangium sp.]MDN5797357.1 hypothetical protein [Intrasporangium sp.]
MLVVCTRDQDLRGWAKNPESGADQWGDLVELPLGKQQHATARLETALGSLKRDEALCLSAHGSDTEIGDEGSGKTDWTWTVGDIASLLKLNARNDYRGPVLISACAEAVSNFSAHLAVALEQEQALNGLWVYGYNNAVPAEISFPRPSRLDKNSELQGTQVNY